MKHILRRENGAYFAGFDCGRPCWASEEHAKPIDLVANKLMVDVIECHAEVEAIPLEPSVGGDKTDAQT